MVTVHQDATCCCCLWLLPYSLGARFCLGLRGGAGFLVGADSELLCTSALSHDFTLLRLRRLFRFCRSDVGTEAFDSLDPPGDIRSFAVGKDHGLLALLGQLAVFLVDHPGLGDVVFSDLAVEMLH